MERNILLAIAIANKVTAKAEPKALHQAGCRVLALFGPDRPGRQCPLLRARPTSRSRVRTSEFDPSRTSGGTAFFPFGALFALATWKVDAIICGVARAVFSEARPYAPARLHWHTCRCGHLAVRGARPKERWSEACRRYYGLRGERRSLAGLSFDLPTSFAKSRLDRGP